MIRLIPLIVIHLSIILFSFTHVTAQSQGDPFNWTEPIKVEANDIFLLWFENQGTFNSYQKIYRYKTDSTWLPTDNLISKTQRHEDNRSNPDGALFTDASTGRFNIDPYDDVVAIWEGEEGVEIVIPFFDTTSGLWTNTVQATIEGVPSNRIYVRTGNFDEDSLDEFVVASVSPDDSIRFYFYDVNSSLQVNLITEYSAAKLFNDFSFDFINYSIETGDFNGDGKDELLLLYSPLLSTGSNMNIYLKVYEINNGSIVPKASRIIQSFTSNDNIEGINIAVTTGQFKNDSKDEIAYVAVIRNRENIVGPYKNTSYIYLAETTADLETINFDPAKRKTIDLGDVQQNTYPNHLSIASGDLNNDGRDEIVFLTTDHYFTYSSDDDLNLVRRVTGNVAEGGLDFIGYNSLKIADINHDNRNEILMVKNFISNQHADGFFVAMATVNNALTTTTTIARLFGDEPQNDNAHPYAIAVGNFDGFNFTIGQPSHYVVNDIVQPIVILNAPPVHFDMFTGNVFDINTCYNGGNCDFYSTYKKLNTTSVEVSTKVNKDWVISNGFGASGSIGAGATLNYETHFTQKYGRNFSNDSTNISTVSISFEVQAREDDQIYTTVTDYDLWEYPLFHGNEITPRRTVLTFVPNNVQGNWFPSKSYNAVSYIPDHEVSNIMSYQAYDTLSNNPNASQTIKASYSSDSFVLSANTSYDWNLSFSDFTSNQADTVMEQGLDIGLNCGLIFDLDYSEKKATTHKTSVSNQVDLKVHLGSVNLGLGDTKYTVTPYAYWDNNGALVVDYATKPELAPPGFPLTWWQQMYGDNSDPTFILPWRLDPEKGFSISEPAKRFQTKDINFNPAKPNPGDTLTITVQVRNFSIIPTPSPVSIKFYIGDPDSGGTPIIGVSGTNTASTIGPIHARGKSTVEFKLVVSSGLPSFPRIYAVLDQDNIITEIHENNNKGFNVLGAPSVTGVEDERDIIPEKYALYQSYPNPFNPSTTIKYSIPQSDNVSLKVYDILGREIAVLLDEYKTAGTYSVEFNAGNLPAGRQGLASGIYFYQLRANNFVETKKMLLLK